MPATLNARLRRLWLNVHLWIGLGLAVLLIPISLSGALLVWHDHVDALLNPDRYAVTAGPSQSPSALLAGAAKELGTGFEPMVVRMPEDAGWPATVMAREQRRGESGGRPRLVTVYLDPSTARVLAKVEFRDSLIGFLHRFHENLTVPEYSGRAVVGWAGVGMLILSLSGIYLWWPRNLGFRSGLRWRRGPATSFNLHHLFGFWIAIPLAVVSATGVYLGFPQQARELLGSVAPMTAQQRGGGFNAPLMSPDPPRCGSRGGSRPGRCARRAAGGDFRSEPASRRLARATARRRERAGRRPQRLRSPRSRRNRVTKSRYGFAGFTRAAIPACSGRSWCFCAACCRPGLPSPAR